MDNKKDSQMAVEKLMNDNGLSKMKALSINLVNIRAKGVKEAVIVQRIIDEEKSRKSEYGRGL